MKSSAQSTWSLVKNATSLGGDCFQLTKSKDGQAGAAWSNTMINLKKPFDLYFQLYFGTDDFGADGIAFVLQRAAAGLSAIGGDGQAMGYSPDIDTSLDVEFDTYQNGSPTNDSVYDHCAIQGSGNLAWDLAQPVPLISGGGNVEDNAYHIVHISWNAPDTTLKVYFDCSLILTFSFDIVRRVFYKKDSIVYYGLTAATGTVHNLQKFCELYLNVSDDTTFCPGDQINLSSSTNFDSYSWSPAAGLSCTNCANPVATPSANTNYVLSATYGCLTATDTVKLTTDCVILPIELTAFTAACDNNAVELNWSTASELDNDYFVVQRSVDSQNFQDVGMVDGAGTSTIAHAYSFTDPHPLIGECYYRLKQVDFGGTSSYSNVQAVSCHSTLGLFVYPNPTHGNTHLQVYASGDASITCTVISLSGKIVFSKALRVTEGNNVVDFDANHVTPGVYDVMITSRYKTLHTLLVIQ